MENSVIERANKWLNGNYDELTKSEVKRLIDNDEKELTESFYRNLEFGTGGLRGIMGVGTNRMNKYTVGMATQGFANYIKQNFNDIEQIKVAISYDSRNNHELFAQTTADVFSANGFKVYMFSALRPTPELSFAIRELGCQAGVMITASHNPKEYNGYKAYWSDGSQLTAPHDTNVIAEVEKISDPSEVKFKGNPELIEMLGDDMDKRFLDVVKSKMYSPEIVKRHKDISIVYTPLHGTGITMVPRALKEMGFDNIYLVEEQCPSDGNFPAAASPNPEEKAAMTLALQKAKEVNATIAMATDPDADRVGIAIKNHKGEYILVNGNQTASLLLYYIYKRRKELGLIKPTDYAVKTIVSTELMSDIPKSYGNDCFNCLTGFKFIAEVIRDNEGKRFYVGGGEESYGFLLGDYCRDKDAISACMMLAEIAAWAADQNKSIFDILIDIYLEYGFYKEGLVNVVRKGKEGAEEIVQMMKNYRTTPPTEINGSKVIKIIDYKLLIEKDLINGTQTPISSHQSDVLQFFTADHSKISVRPSGTEPKIKYYFSIKEPLTNAKDYESIELQLDAKIEAIKKSLNL